jgi:hypothetical protein
MKVKKLEARRREFDATRAEGHEGTSKYIKTTGGKIVLIHRPGSNK